MTLKEFLATLTAGVIGVQALREAKAEEFHQILQLVNSAIAKVLGKEYIHLEALYSDHAVVARDGRYWSYPFTLDDNNTVILGTAVEVVKTFNPVGFTESAPQLAAGDGLFVEAAARGPSSFLVRVIRSGTSLNNVKYPPSVLREATPLFDGSRVFAKSDAEHIRGQGKDIGKLVGSLSKPRYVEAAGGGEIHAEFEAFESHPATKLVREAVERGKTDIFGLSIDAVGTAARKGRLVEAVSIKKVNSVDLIVEPGAGGQVIQLIEAAGAKDDDMRELMLKKLREGAPDAYKALGEDATDDEILVAYTEAFGTTPPNPDADGDGEGGTNAGSDSSVEQRLAMIEARATARTLIADSRLPDVAKKRLQAQFDGMTAFTEADVTQAIDGEVEYLGNFAEGNAIQGLGGDVDAGEDRSDKVKQQLDDFFDPSKPAGSFKEAYGDITGDRRVTGRIEDCDVNRMRESFAGFDIVGFQEAVSAGTFAQVLGDSITRAMVREYNNNPLYSDWRWIVDVVNLNDFRTQRRTRMGGYGNLPIVAENGSYDPLATPGDEEATYAAAKRGGTETISLEAIRNDDVGAIQRIPVKLATAAGRTLYEFIFDDLFGDNANIYDGVALFHATHNNLGTAALDATSFAAARLAMIQQAEADSAKRLGLILRHLAVPTDLEELAYDLFVRNANNDETFVQSRKPLVHVVPHWTDANNWFAVAEKSQVPLIELGFMDGETPALFVQDNPTQGSLFSNDQIMYKIRHIYAGAVIDYRGFYGAIVA